MVEAARQKTVEAQKSLKQQQQQQQPILTSSEELIDLSHEIDNEESAEGDPLDAEKEDGGSDDPVDPLQPPKPIVREHKYESSSSSSSDSSSSRRLVHLHQARLLLVHLLVHLRVRVRVRVRVVVSRQDDYNSEFFDSY